VSAQVASTDGLPGVPGDYHGRPTRRLESAHCWVEVLSGGGPRIVGFGLRGGPNLLAETPQASWDAGHGLFELLGGHRLWFAPETPECSVPDSTGLTLAAISADAMAADANPADAMAADAIAADATAAAGLGIRLVGAVEGPTGLRKTIEVRLDPGSAAVSLRHTLTNEGSRTFELSPWPITQLRPGGVAIVELPAPVAEHVVKPNRVLVLWPYAAWSDDRLEIGERSLSVTARPGRPFKVGCLSTIGEVGYLREGVLFTKRFDPAADAPHPDLGCNVEIYCDESSIELESLAPLVRLGPGDSVRHDERWELRRVG
jgi:hypothetical protein